MAVAVRAGPARGGWRPGDRPPLSSTRIVPALGCGFLLLPLTFIGGRLGTALRVHAVAWILDLLLFGLVLAVVPLSRRAVRSLLPYLVFLGFSAVSLWWTPDLYKGLQTLAQLTLPAVAYLLAWSVGELDELLLARVSRICLWWVGLIVAIWLAGRTGAGFVDLSVRPAAISLAGIFVLTTVHSSRRRTLAVGLTAVLVAGVTGSRTASVVLFLLLLLSPSLRISARARWGVIVAGSVFVVLLAQTAAFKARFFFASNASLVDVLTFSDKFNTSGRRELWSGLSRSCSTSPLLGKGIGAAYPISLKVTNGGINQPHDDYLRTYCDVGVTGSVLVWGFFLFVAVRAAWRYHLGVARKELQAAAGLVVLAFLLFAVTDNPIVYAAHFMAPLGVILGLAEGALDRATPGTTGAIRTAGTGERRRGPGNAVPVEYG